MTIGERLIFLRKNMKMTQEEFGSPFGLVRNTLSRYETGVRLPSEPTLVAICKTYGVNYEWLVNGTGEMFLDLPDTLIEELKLEYNLDDQDCGIIKAYLKLAPYEKDIFKKWLKIIIKEEQKK